MSFSAEMKDFISAYSTGQKINASRTDQDYKESLTDATKKKTERDNDPDTLELQDQQARANLAKTKAEISRTGAATGYTNTLAQRIRQGAVPGVEVGSGLLPPSGAGGLVTAPTQPAVPGAVPLQNTINTEAYAEGGSVVDGSDDDEDDTAQPAAQPAVPVQQPVASSPAQDTDFSSQRRDAMPKGLNGIVSPQLVHDATRAGLKWGAEAFGLAGGRGIRSTAQKLMAQQFAAGRGGLTTAEMEAAKKAVDPEGKLTESQRNMAALGSVYQYQMNKGNPDGAARVAFQMLQHYRVATQRYAALAAHAAEQGDMDLATKAAVKAYANVPDGRDVRIERSPDNPNQLLYYYTDENGNDLVKGIATPQQLASSAMGLAQGGFDKAILTAAGAREADTKGGAVKTPSARDRKTLDEMAQEPVDAAKTAWQTANKDKPADDEYWGDVSDATKHILSENPSATPREAFKAAQALHTLNKDDPGKTNFKVEPGDGDNPVSTIKFDNGLKIKLNDDQLESVLLARAARLKKRDEADDAAADAEDKPGVMAKLGELSGAIGRAGADAVSGANTSVFPGGAQGPAVPTDDAARPVRRDAPYIPPVSTANTRPAVPTN